MTNENKPTSEELIKRFAFINNLSEEEAEKVIGASTEEEILANIKKFTLDKINQQVKPLNRA